VPQYFERRPDSESDPGEITLDVAGRTLTLTTDRGVFSRHRLDPGTAVLLRKAPPPPVAGTVLDLGCGYGPIACALAAQAPESQVWAVDVNERARGLAARNAVTNGLVNITVADPDDVPPGLTFDAIFSNPPVRIGQEAMRELLEQWLRRLTPNEPAKTLGSEPGFGPLPGARRAHGPRVGPGGRAFLVVQRHLGADSLQRWLQRQGLLTERLASSKGYRVLVVAGTLPE
jgi:16S rRNA (guanine1207-N2)-methyltransferase